MPKLHHFDNLGTARFITASCYNRFPYFNEDMCRRILINHLDNLRRDTGIKILGYVIMPDHIHLVIYPPPDSKTGVLIGQLKGRTAHEIISSGVRCAHRASGQPAVWERRCYDHNCRMPETMVEKIIYCHNNPVKKDLVATPGEWRWSSYGWYHDFPDIPLEIDGIQL